MIDQLFRLDAPICAIEQGGSFETVMCERCERGHTKRVRPANVELVCKPRNVWRTDAGAVLVEHSVAQRLGASLNAITLKPASCTWRRGLHGSKRVPTPELLQIGSMKPMKASAGTVEYENCSCGSLRYISLSPLIVQRQQIAGSDGIWFLFENPEILIFSGAVRETLLSLDGDLEFEDVYFEDSYEPPIRTFDGEDWSDI